MSIFDNQEQTNSEQKNESNDAANDIVNALMEIKRDDGSPKYNDPVEALKALKASQDHIRQIEADNASLREKANKADTLEQTLEQMRANMNNNEKPNPQTEDKGGRSVEAAEELVARLLEQKLSERDAVNTAVSNVKRVNDALVKKFGDETTAVKRISERATALGTTPQALKELAAQNPSLVLELFGSSTATPTPSSGSVNLGGYREPEVERVTAPEKSILSGPHATHKNQMEHFRKIRENVNKRLKVEY